MQHAFPGRSLPSRRLRNLEAHRESRRAQQTIDEALNKWIVDCRAELEKEKVIPGDFDPSKPWKPYIGWESAEEAN